MSDQQPPEPVKEIAQKLIAAAHQRFGDPGTASGDYFNSVILYTDVPAYFERIMQLMESARLLADSGFDPDAYMVMHAGLDHLQSVSTKQMISGARSNG